MDVNKIDKLLEKIAKADENELVAMAEKMSEGMARNIAAEDDRKAFEEAGIERMLIFLKGEDTVLLVKPIKNMCRWWQLNLFGSGVLNLGEKPKFKVNSIGVAELFRFSIDFNDSSYWVYLTDEKQAKDLAVFLNITISSE